MKLFLFFNLAPVFKGRFTTGRRGGHQVESRRDDAAFLVKCHSEKEWRHDIEENDTQQKDIDRQQSSIRQSPFI